MRAWLNGDLLADPTQGAVAVTDHGFTVGDGVFEAVKTLAGTPFALTRHLERLERSAAVSGCPCPTSTTYDVGWRRSRATIGSVGSGSPDSAGPHPMGSGRGGGPPTLVVAWSAIDVAPSETTVVTVPWTRNEHGATAGLKTTSYADNVIALAHAVERGGSEAVLANTAGNLCEGTGTNVFYVVDGELRTPSLASGCLAGVTRALVIDWCGAREVDEPLADVRATASEAFLASTTRDVQAIARWDDRDLPSPGPVTAQCAQTWRAREAESMEP